MRRKKQEDKVIVGSNDEEQKKQAMPEAPEPPKEELPKSVIELAKDMGSAMDDLTYIYRPDEVLNMPDYRFKGELLVLLGGIWRQLHEINKKMDD